jgi:hypothetical protein
MKKINLIPIFIILISFTSCGQVKETPNKNHINRIDNKLLFGKWRSESDEKVILLFEKEKFIELYGNDTTDNIYYKLSDSCTLEEKRLNLTMQNTFLIFYSSDSTIQQCNELLNLTNHILSWMNNKNGKISVFNKIK